MDGAKQIHIVKILGLEVFVQDNIVTLYVDGEEITSADFTGYGPLNDGLTGLANKNSITHFDNFCIEEVDLFDLVV